MQPIVITHGGVSFPEEHKDGVEAAAKEGMRALTDENKSALEAAVAAVSVMEDDGRYDAGTGSYYNLNGEIEMDAAVMDEQERCGAVAAIKSVKNPVKVAFEIINTPHILLVGDGALEFAKSKGFEEVELGTDRSKQRLEEVRRRIAEGDIPDWAPRWKDFQLPGTVGAVVFDGKSRFGAANSSGGTSYQLSGRVGDSAIIGAGLYASSKGAVVGTGIGEDIIQKVLCKSVYDKIIEGMGVESACEWGVSLYPSNIPMGIIAVTAEGFGIAVNDEIPVCVLK